jgi:hypothetical protein
MNMDEGTHMSAFIFYGLCKPLATGDTSVAAVVVVVGVDGIVVDVVDGGDAIEVATMVGSSSANSNNDVDTTSCNFCISADNSSGNTLLPANATTRIFCWASVSQ